MKHSNFSKQLYKAQVREHLAYQKQLDSSYRAFTEQRCLMKKITVENELLKAENEELKHREGRIKDFCRGASTASTLNKQAVPWEAD